MCILGDDIGNYGTKVSTGHTFLSKVSKTGGLLNSKPFTVNGETLYIGEGSWDTEYRKVKKQHIKTFFLYSIAISTNDYNNKVVVGLPLSQYKQDRDELKNILLQQRIHTVEVNGAVKKYFVEDVDVYPEGVSTENGVHVDIGGRTTDACMVENMNVLDPISLPYGTLNLYMGYINSINSKYGLDLKIDSAEGIIKNGLRIDGNEVDTSFAMGTFKEFVESLINQLQIAYSLKAKDIIITGGGGQLLFRPLKNRVPQAQLSDDPILGNAKNFKRRGEQLWL
jgi:plasmid segregation protein ParM